MELTGEQAAALIAHLRENLSVRIEARYDGYGYGNDQTLEVTLLFGGQEISSSRTSIRVPEDPA